MSFLESAFLAFAIVAGSFIGTSTMAPSEPASASAAPVNCERPCRVDDPKCVCGGKDDGGK